MPDSGWAGEPSSVTLTKSRLRVAAIHARLCEIGRAELILAEILRLYPMADLFCAVDFLSPADRAVLAGVRARTSFMQVLPHAASWFGLYRVLLPLAVRRFDISSYDLVISTSAEAGRAVPARRGRTHICYCHDPAPAGRVAGGLDRLLGGRTSGIDRFVASSALSASRLRRRYRRDAAIIALPVDTERFAPQPEKADFFLAVSSMAGGDGIELVVRAFGQLPAFRLVVLGEGPQWRRLRREAGGNVTLLGWQGEWSLADHARRARAYICTGGDESRLRPGEALSCATPVIGWQGGAGPAFGEGAAGLEIQERSVAGVVAALARFEAAPTDPAPCNAAAARLGRAHFQSVFGAFAALVAGAA